MSTTRGLRLISVFEAVKGTLGLVVGIGAWLVPPDEVQGFAERIVSGLRLDPAARYAALFIHEATLITAADLGTVALGAVAYSAFRFAEAYGLWKEQAWAEWLAVVSGSIYVPFEIRTLVRNPTWIKVVVLGVNLLVVLYVAKALARPGRRRPPAS